MRELNDMALLQEYVRNNSEEAFATLVRRHVNKVYSIALRHTRNPNQAEEITQTVFVILARKSRDLSKSVILSGWLCRTAQLTAVTFIRSEIRRARREQEAHMQTLSNEGESDVWSQIAPLLDGAMARLSETDHHALVLRYYDGRSMKEIGSVLGTGEDTAKKRVNRAVEKLRLFFTKRGVVLPAAILTAAISANSVQAAPVALAKTVTAVAMTKGIAASGSTLTLIKGTLKFMAYKKVTALTIGVAAALLLGGTATVVVLKTGVSKASILDQMSSMKTVAFPAIMRFAQAHQDELPKSLAELHPYLAKDLAGMDDEHWEMLASGKLTPQLGKRDVILLQQKNVPPGKQKIIVYADGHIEYNR